MKVYWNADAFRHTRFVAKIHVAYDGAGYRAYATMNLRPSFAQCIETRRSLGVFRLWYSHRSRRWRAMPHRKTPRFCARRSRLRSNIYYIRYTFPVTPHCYRSRTTALKNPFSSVAEAFSGSARAPSPSACAQLSSTGAKSPFGVSACIRP